SAVGAPKRIVGFPKGVYPNQPNPYGEFGWLGKATGVVLVLWFLLSFVYLGRSQSQLVKSFQVPPKAAVAPPVADPDGTTPPAPPGDTGFDVERSSSRDPATLEVTASAAVDNTWAACDCALVDTVHEHLYPFSVEVSYYHGVDDGEGWSEGSQTATIELGAI